VHLSTTAAAVLAGGLGTRLRSVIADRPKVLADVCGRPFLAHLLDQLTTAGIGHAVVCTGYLGDQIRLTFGNDYRGVRLTYSQEAAPLGTGGALRLATPHFDSDPILVLNGDSFCQTPLAAVAETHASHRAAATIVLARVEDTRRYGRVVFGENNVVTAFEEKGDAAGPGWINAGIYVLAAELLRGIAANKMVSLERDVFPSWVGRGLFAYPNEGPFIDIGTPESYAAAEAFFSQDLKERQ
jgi:D-glycero-alpha-D-manno-heptose 1-phosphate guanylyltransferase